jgi:hypothetical protein
MAANWSLRRLAVFLLGLDDREVVAMSLGSRRRRRRTIA